MMYGISSFFNNSNSYGGFSYGISSMYGLLSDYNQVRSSGYRNILKAYYDLEKEETSSSNVNSTTKKEPTLSKNKVNNDYSDVKLAANELYSSSKNLYATGKDSIFNKVEQTIENSKTGEKTKVVDYNKDKIIAAVNSFVADYNSFVSNVDKANNNVFSTKSDGIISLVENSADKLKEIGITVDENSKLTVDKEKLKDADVENIKEIFNGTSSIAWKAGQDSFSVGIAATSMALNSGSYYNYSWLA